MSDTTTLRKWFEEFTAQTGEVPTKIVLGASSRYYSTDTDEWSDLVTQPNIVVPFGDLTPEILDRPFSAGFGGNESRDLCAWSKSWVIFSDNYDGAEGLQWVPRNPIDHHPIRPGGG